MKIMGGRLHGELSVRPVFAPTASFQARGGVFPVKTKDFTTERRKALLAPVFADCSLKTTET